MYERIEDAVLGMDAGPAGLDQRMIELDGIDNKAAGSNALLAVSLAAAQAASTIRSSRCSHRRLVSWAQPVMPVPMMNIINGGPRTTDGRAGIMVCWSARRHFRSAALRRRDLPH
jgi:enolase